MAASTGLEVIDRLRAFVGKRSRRERRGHRRAAEPSTPERRGPGGRTYDYVVVVAPGRSGSTLLQGLLNEIPGTVVRGENDLYLHGIYRVMARFLRFQELHSENRTRKVTSPFYGLMTIRRGQFIRFARRLFLDGALGPGPHPEVERVGFKEVLWYRIDPEETEDFFAFMDDTFPGIRYVLNRRDPEVMLGSGFWRGQDPQLALARVGRVFEVQDHLRETRPDRTFDVQYEALTGDDLSARDRLLRDLVRFVTDRPAVDGVLDAMCEAMNRGHGPHPFGASRADTLGPTNPHQDGADGEGSSSSASPG